ncbi:sodium- and chloride-dependent creatine transporter 1-like [Diadema setosum]|uniref:sodium- and chloride-dependent creatine transporter 1-like n=1 Tax=Diadema setosum TaxID=31175 RepID=UPI003B3B7DBC
MATEEAVKKGGKCWPFCRKLTTGGAKSNKRRETWGSRFDFMVTSLGHVVSLENIWWLPYLFYRNGGVVFMIPYLLFVLLGALPLVVLEFAVGQYSSSNMKSVWNAIPIMRGVSYGRILAMVVYRCFYSVIISYSVYFCFASFTSNLPWEGCHHSWNTPYCSELIDDCLENGGIIVANGSCANQTMISKDEFGEFSMSFRPESVSTDSRNRRSVPSEEYWRNAVLQESSDIEETGGVVWKIALCNLFVWVVIFFLVARSIEISGKVAYFTALFPYILLMALLVRALTLDGSADGIHLFSPHRSAQWYQKLKSPQFWGVAAIYVFHSFGSGTGSLTTLASFNSFHTNFIIDAVVVVLVNSLTSIYCGLTVFSILGVLAKQTGFTVYDVVDADYSTGWAGMIWGFFLPVSFAWVYGFERLKNDIRSMLDISLHLRPVNDLYQDSPPHPRMCNASRPTAFWGPALPEDREKAMRVHQQYGTTGPLMLQQVDDDLQTGYRLQTPGHSIQSV